MRRPIQSVLPLTSPTTPRVTVPAVVWERSTRRVLTLEDVTAIKITDAESLRLAGIDPAEVAPVFASVMFDQLFTNGFFHADPHPGNIFVTPANDPSSEHPWKLTFIDFGMMGEVPVQDAQRAAEAAHRCCLTGRQRAGDRHQRRGGTDAVGRHR